MSFCTGGLFEQHVDRQFSSCEKSCRDPLDGAISCGQFGKAVHVSEGLWIARSAADHSQSDTLVGFANQRADRRAGTR